MYGAAASKEKTGYNIRDKNGNINTKKFMSVLDNSLDSIKLREVYEKITRKKDFSFWINKKEYTQNIINVEFSYAYKEFNKAGKNTYIREGYYFKDCIIEDGAYVKDGQLIAIQTNVQINNPLSASILGDYFTYENDIYNQTGNIRVLKNKAELRESLYNNGFTCDGIEYIRYKRSSGSSRVGKCLFVNKILADRMTKWDKCGLNIKDGDKIDLAAYEAYISLSMSSIIDTIEILPENILLIDDYESIFDDEVVAVDIKNNQLNAEQKIEKISNSVWDGQSLMDISMFGKYKNKGMLLLRNRFFKTCAFNTNIQQWFKDNNITDITQLNGFTVANRVEDIKLITTPSSIKYLKFGTMKQWLKNINYTFGIVKYEKETHYFNGRMVQSHYQLFNTLQLSFDEMKQVIQPSLDYVTAVRNDPDILRYHIKYPYEKMEMTPLTSKNEIIFKLLGINNKFAQTKLYYDFRKDLVKAFMRNLKQGHILIHGNYSTLFGNPIEMLQQSIGIFKGDSQIGVGNVHNTNFEYGKTLLGSRSPHICASNIWLMKNEKNSLIDEYINLTDEIICVNSIGENLLQKLNGSDFDSDTALLTDNDLLINKTLCNYDNFKVPTSFVSARKSERYYTNEHKADLDIKTSVNKIGEIVNLSQQLNSLYWDRINSGQTVEGNVELYYDICKLAVLSGIEIDRAKKEFIINSAKEIKLLKDKYKITQNDKMVKPMFFKMITLENGYELSDKIYYKYFKTSMDYLQKIISSYNFFQSRGKKRDIIPLSDIIKEPKTNFKVGYYSSQRNRIIAIVRETMNSINSLFIDYNNKTKEEKEIVRNQVADIRQECVEYIDSISSSEPVMYLVLKDIDNKKYKDISRFLFEILFGTPNKSFFTMIINSKEDLCELVEWKNGDIKLYDYTFYKQKIA